MSHKFDNITIVGGGSSGWMTAATFIKFFPNKNISIIESPDYPIVGVGESTLGQINIWKNLLEIDGHPLFAHSIIAATSEYFDLPIITADKGFNKIEELNILFYQE